MKSLGLPSFRIARNSAFCACLTLPISFLESRSSTTCVLSLSLLASHRRLCRDQASTVPVLLTLASLLSVTRNRRLLSSWRCGFECIKACRLAYVRAASCRRIGEISATAKTPIADQGMSSKACRRSAPRAEKKLYNMKAIYQTSHNRLIWAGWDAVSRAWHHAAGAAGRASTARPHGGACPGRAARRRSRPRP